ncbi:HU family DNA-binding protein [Metamycoplasma auris]|uniref:DNA-binding protein HU-beta n=1 Tax=Metamycoplasma auris TaxID=51363 RepID=A0A2W7G593_9BACT|nr:HU family DNA-binding protein [Metamycoplasma auris]PZW01437.1 DNA-binding protein HU-beta [Metamycoplasma auris]
MTKKELIKVTAEKTGFQNAMVESIIDQMISTLVEKMSKGEQVTISGFGVFSSRVIPPRIKRNNITKENIQMPEKLDPKFKFSNSLKEDINEIFKKTKK